MPDDPQIDTSDPTTAIDPFSAAASSPNQAAPLADPYADPYASLQWPPPSWGLAPTPPAGAPPIDSAPGIIGPTPAPPMDAIAPTPVLVPALDQSLAPAPTNLAEPEPVLPAGALTPDRAPTDTTGSAPINVTEAFADSQRGAPATSTEDSELERMRQQYRLDPLNDEAGKYLTPEERGTALDQMSPKQFTAYVIRKQDEKQERERGEAAKLEREKREADEREYQVHLAARAETRAQQAKLNEDVAATLKQKNPSWMESRSTGQKIAAALSAVVGGLSMGAGTGYHGPNLGLEMMKQAADDYNANMRQEQEQKRALLGQQQSSITARVQDEAQDYHERTVHQLAMYESAKQALATEQQKYNSQGTTSLQIGTAMRAIDQQQAQVQQAYAQKTFDNNIKLMGETHKAAELQQKTKQDAAGNALRGAEIYTTQRGQNLTNQQHKDTLALERDKLAASDKDKAAAKADKDQKEADERTFGVFPQTTFDKDGKPVGVEYKPALNKDGKEFIPKGRPEDVSKLREKSAAVQDMAQIMDRVQRLRTGWSNSVHDREELQQINALWALNKVNFKNYAQLGALSESDYSLVDKGLGTSDPTKFLDQSAGIKEARSAIVRSLNTSMRGLKYDNPKDFEIADTSETTAPVKDAIDMLGAHLNEQPGSGPASGQNEKRLLDNLDQMYKVASGEGLGGKDAASVQIREFYENPQYRSKALQYLKDASENAPSEAVKDAATKMYNSIVGPQAAPGIGSEANPPNVAGKPMNEGG